MYTLIDQDGNITTHDSFDAAMDYMWTSPGEYHLYEEGKLVLEGVISDAPTVL